jgi:virulence factor Mce-like protein
MRRVLIAILTVAAAGAYLITGTGASNGGSAPSYTVELDNAFGLVEGADVKIAGVRAGTISAMRVDKKTKHALIDINIDKTGFGDLREDVTCETRPQSLIGEYFIDCQPGRSSHKLAVGSKIPVERTSTTIAPDLVNNILRRPYRERLSLIVGELGAGVGGRGTDLNDAIRRASPALRETEEVLEILGRQNTILRDLVTNADTVIGDLAGNRRNLVRFVKEAGDTAEASAERRDDIERGFQLLPTFLRELRPTMSELGRVAVEQQPSLRDLNASAGQLEDMFRNLGPFSESTRVNLRSLAEASGPGRRAARSARPTVAQLAKFAQDTPELSKNLRIVLEHLNDRDFAVEPDPRSPDGGGRGFTGLEAIWRWIYANALAINIFDRNGYILKINLFESECSEYHNPESLKEHLKEDPDFYRRCAALLGPNQPGITTPDPTGGSRPTSRSARERNIERRTRPDEDKREAAAQEDKKREVDTDEPKRALEKKLDEVKERLKKDGPAIDLRDTLDQILPDAPRLPDIPALQNVQAGNGGGQDQALLDYLFGK